MKSVLISPQDVRAFAAASHDQSPLHVDADYARRTPFGRTVVHGVLATLTALGQLAPRAGALALAKLTVDFQGPVFVDTAYEVVIEDAGARAKMTVRDGGRILLRASVIWADGSLADLEAGTAVAPRRTARADEVELGPVIDADYAPEPTELLAILKRLELPARGIGAGAVAAMMAASYVVGMERPGTQALFARLQLAFSPSSPSCPAHIRAELMSLDPRFAMATLDVNLCGAPGEIRALVRPHPVALEPARIDEAFEALSPRMAADAFEGKTAVVIGGGRGLGAALTLALAKGGARVLATYAGSRETADTLAGLGPRIAVLQADATKAEDCTRLVVALGEARIDVLVLCASSPVLPLALGLDTAERALAFVETSLAMAVVPVAALADALAPACTLVAISSSYVTDPPSDFAHYVAAKGALEGLLRGVARDRELPLVIARPPRVLTDMTNTPFGAEDTLRAEVAAVKVVAAVAAHSAGVVVVDDFGGPPG